MRAVAAVAWSGMRQRAAALAGLALVVALGLGVALAADEAARRTERAYPDYLRDADVAELIVNPSLSTARAEELIASTPGVLDHRTDDLLTVTFDDGAPRTRAEVDHGLPDAKADPALAYTQVRMSTDGRYIDQDRPIVHEGRMLRPEEKEAFLSREAADVLGLSVGDEIPIAFWSTSYDVEFGIQPDDIVEPIGRSSASVVGIGVLADEVLVDELYPRQRVLLSPAVGAPFTCTLGPVGGDDLSLEEMFAAIVPADCALSYRFFSLRIAGGDAGVDAVAQSLTESFKAENELLPEVLGEQEVGYFLIPSATKDQRERVQSSVGPAVTVLRSFAVAAALATVVVAGLGALRIARRARARTTTWSSLGMTRGQRLLAVAIPLVGATVAGVIVAAGIGFALSGFGPVASVGVLEPSTRLGLAGEVLAVTGGVSAILLLAGVGLAAGTVVRSPGRRASRRSFVSRATQSLETSRGLGVRAATRGAGAGAVLVGSTVAVGVVVAGLVFTTSLDGLTEEPARYGWPYDAAATIGFGYGGGVAEDIRASLDRPEVVSWGVANLGTFTIDGQSIAVIAGLDQFGSIPLPIVDGRLPETAEEIALGRQSAEDLGIEIGDRVLLVHSSYFGEREAVVTGTVVLPAVGAFESDRTAAGVGALLSDAFFGALVSNAELAFGLDPGSLASTGLAAFVVMDLADGVDPTEFLAGVEGVQTWDRNGFGVMTYTGPVRPAAIADVEGMRRLPLLFGSLVAAAMAGGYAISIAVATRARRRELAVLGALGCSPRQLAASVRWHALTVAGIAAVVGAPLGVLAGRTSYRAFATDLGVLPVVEIPGGWATVVVAAAIAVGLLAAALPARSARNLPPAAVLRVE